MIKLTAIGNIGKDAVLGNANGKSVINFSVAVSEKGAQGVAKTIWVECAYWTEKTGILPYLKSGVKVYVEGSPSIRTYTTNANANGASLQLRIDRVELVGGGPREQQQPAGANQQQQPDAELPF